MQNQVEQMMEHEMEAVVICGYKVPEINCNFCYLES